MIKRAILKVNGGRQEVSFAPVVGIFKTFLFHNVPVYLAAFELGLLSHTVMQTFVT